MAYAFLPLIWFFVAKSFGISINFFESVYSWFVSSIGRYIPGKVWQFVGRVSTLNHPKGKVLSAMLYEHLILMLTASVFSLIYPYNIPLQLTIIFVLLGIVTFWRYFLPYAKKFGLNISFYPKNTGYVIFSVLFGFLYWTVSSFSAYAISKALDQGLNFGKVAFVFSFSFVASYILPLTPAGLGIREGIISFLMGYDLKSSAFSILTRLIITSVDLFVVSSVLIYRRLAK